VPAVRATAPWEAHIDRLGHSRVARRIPHGQVARTMAGMDVAGPAPPAVDRVTQIGNLKRSGEK
jgi:hypothetical protein